MNKKLLGIIASWVMLIVSAIPAFAASYDMEYVASDDYQTEAQGVNNWYYMVEKEGKFYEMYYDADPGMKKWRYPDLASGNYITGSVVHPGSNNVSTARVWEAPFGGTVRLESNGNVRKDNTGGGNGITARILKNNDVLFEKFIEGTDGVGFNYSLTVDVVAGDRIYFVADGGTSDAYGATAWNPIVKYSQAAVYSENDNVINKMSELAGGDVLKCTFYDTDSKISDEFLGYIVIYDDSGRLRQAGSPVTVDFAESEQRSAEFEITLNEQESYEGWSASLLILTSTPNRYYAMSYLDGLNLR